MPTTKSPGSICLEHLPHGSDIIGGVTPVPFGFQVAEEELVLFASFDGSQGTGDLAGDEGLAAAGGFVVEEDAVGGEELIALAVVTGEPVGIDLGGGIGALRLEGGVFVLRRGGGTEHLAGGGLVEAGLDPALADDLQQADGAQRGDIAGVFGQVKADADMGLGGEVVDLVGFYAQRPGRPGCRCR